MDEIFDTFFGVHFTTTPNMASNTPRKKKLHFVKIILRIEFSIRFERSPAKYRKSWHKLPPFLIRLLSHDFLQMPPNRSTRFDFILKSLATRSTIRTWSFLWLFSSFSRFRTSNMNSLNRLSRSRIFSIFLNLSSLAYFDAKSPNDDLRRTKNYELKPFFYFYERKIKSKQSIST